VIYFTSNDRSPEQNIDTKLDKLIKDVQKFYADEMERHGFGRKTFRIETGVDGNVVVHRVNGQFNSSHYDVGNDIHTVTNKVISEVHERFERQRKVDFVVADVGNALGGVGSGDSHSGLAFMTANSDYYDTSTYFFYLAAHELAHAFGLDHDFRNGAHILSYSTRVVVQLAACTAEWLDVHRYFNTTQNSIDTPATVEMLPPLKYPPNAIRLRFKLNDTDGLHQVQLKGPAVLYSGIGLIACKKVSGTSKTVEFVTTEFTLGNDVTITVIDVNGNFAHRTYSVQEEDVQVGVNDLIDINGDGVIDADDRKPATLRIVSGNNQRSLQKSWLENPFVVEVRDAGGKPVVGVEVVFRGRPGSSDATFSVTNPRTDANGLARCLLKTTSAFHMYQIEAIVAGISESVIFHVMSSEPQVLVKRSQRPPMYWISGDKLQSITGDKAKFYGAETFGSFVRSAAIDTSPNGKLYWVAKVVPGESEGGGILRGSHDISVNEGSRSEVLTLVNNAIRPIGIAIDTTKQKLYWTDSAGNIQQANLNGSNIQNLVTGLDLPEHITVDVVREKLYWTETQGYIRQANLDGSNIQTVATNLGTIGSITIAGSHLYWTEKIGEELGKISRANLDGSNVVDIVTLSSSVPVGVAVDAADYRLYWTETQGHIRRADLDGSNMEDVFAGLPNLGQLILNVPLVIDDQDTDNMNRITISEIMVASTESGLPQWIELHNTSKARLVNLEGWKLEIHNYESDDFSGQQKITMNLKKKIVRPNKTVLIVSKQGRSSDYFQNEQIYNLNVLHTNIGDTVLNEEGFYLKLSNAAGERSDEVGNLEGGSDAKNKLVWRLPKGTTENGARASMIRRYDNNTLLPGTEKAGWVSAAYTKLTIRTIRYYGHPRDIGAPGIESGDALPVQLSMFTAKLTHAGVVVNWTTESELDNAGFNIYRSVSKQVPFVKMNPTLITGAGTTGERNEYTWTDTTAKPKTVYYYRIEDVSHAGVRKQLTTVRLRGLISASGKLTTRWADLKTGN